MKHIEDLQTCHLVTVEEPMRWSRARIRYNPICWYAREKGWCPGPCYEYTCIAHDRKEEEELNERKAMLEEVEL